MYKKIIKFHSNYLYIIRLLRSYYGEFYLHGVICYNIEYIIGNYVLLSFLFTRIDECCRVGFSTASFLCKGSVLSYAVVRMAGCLV